MFRGKKVVFLHDGKFVKPVRRNELDGEMLFGTLQNTNDKT